MTRDAGPRFWRLSGRRETARFDAQWSSDWRRPGRRGNVSHLKQQEHSACYWQRLPRKHPEKQCKMLNKSPLTLHFYRTHRKRQIFDCRSVKKRKTITCAAVCTALLNPAVDGLLVVWCRSNLRLRGWSSSSGLPPPILTTWRLRTGLPPYLKCTSL